MRARGTLGVIFRYKEKMEAIICKIYIKIIQYIESPVGQGGPQCWEGEKSNFGNKKKPYEENGDVIF